MKLLTAVTLAASVIGATAFENCVTKEAGGEVFFLCDEPRDAPGIEVMKELEAIGFKGYQWRQEDNGVADVETDLKARDLTAEKRDPHNAPPALEDRGNQRRSWWPSLPKVAYMYYKTPAKTPVQEDIKSDSDAEKKKAPAPVAGEKERRSRWPFIPKTEYMYYKTPASAPVKEDTKADSDAEKKEKRSRWPFIPKTEYMYYKTPTSQEGDKPAPDA